MIESVDRKKGVLATALLLALLLTSIQPASASIGLEESQSSIIATGDHLRAEISKASPSITFSDPTGDGETHRLEFVRMIAFNSTNGGYYERKGQQFSANFADAVWQTSSSSSHLPGGGTLLTINMTAVLDFYLMTNATSWQQSYGGQGNGQEPAQAPISDAMRLTFTYRMASRNMSYQFGGYQFTLTNDSEMKILIKIEMLASMPADRLCIEQALMANNGADYGGNYRLYDGIGVHDVDGSVNETSNGQQITHRHTTRTQIQQRIAYESGNEQESGFYSWVPLVERHVGGTVTNSTVTASYGTDGSSLRLFCSFATAPAGTSIIVDPTIGTIISGIINYLVGHLASIGIGALAGSAIVISLLAWRRRGFAKEDSSVTASLEDNPFYAGEKKPPDE